MTELSSKTILNELQEARTTISRLTASNARSVGWENRLSATLKEKDDMQQERDSESNRAKLAESRLAAMKDKTGLTTLFSHYSVDHDLGYQQSCNPRFGGCRTCWKHEDYTVQSLQSQYYKMPVLDWMFCISR